MLKILKKQRNKPVNGVPKNPERRKESKRKWYAENPEKAKESTRKWKEENPEKNLRLMPLKTA